MAFISVPCSAPAHTVPNEFDGFAEAIKDETFRRDVITVGEYSMSIRMDTLVGCDTKNSRLPEYTGHLVIIVEKTDGEKTTTPVNMSPSTISAVLETVDVHVQRKQAEKKAVSGLSNGSMHFTFDSTNSKAMDMISQMEKWTHVWSRNFAGSSRW
jgi:hypothetical protein